MRLSVVTPTADRPVAIRLCERWMAAQTRQPDEWIVADGGEKRADLHMRQLHLYNPRPAGWANYVGNVIDGVRYAIGDVVVFMEDDDWYAPTYLQTVCELLRDYTAVGCSVVRYYHLPTRRLLALQGPMASLAQTAFRAADWSQVMVDCCLRVAPMVEVYTDRKANQTVDGLFWQTLRRIGHPQKPTMLYRSPLLSVGMKGMPGSRNISVSRRPSDLWEPDDDLSTLRAWMGKDAEAYEDLAWESVT